MTQVRRVLAAAIVVVTMAACGGSAASSSPAGSASSPLIPVATPLTSAATSPTPASAGTSPTPADSTPVPLAVDGTLLGVLPARVGDVEMTPDPENAAQLIGDPTLGTTASGLAVARYTQGDEIMVVSVVQLRPGIFTEGFYDGWRADYDASACAPAGGATGAETVQLIGTHPIHVGTCANGASTFHASLDGDVLVSAIAVGKGSLARGVMDGLRP